MRLKPSSLLISLFWFCVQTWGQAGPAKDMTLTVGRGELIQFDGDVKTVAASEPKIADVVVVSPREVMVNAKGIGKATIVVWEDRALPRRYNVNVVGDSQDYDSVRKAVKDAVGDSAVTVQGNLETIVLTGDVKSVAESKRAEAIASTYGKKVVNLLGVPAPSDPRQILLEVKFASIDRSALQEVGFNFVSRNQKMLGLGTTQQ
jgi:pilus assembly protein CpaC